GSLTCALAAEDNAKKNDGQGGKDDATGKAVHETLLHNQATKGARPPSTNGISYHGGPILLNTVNVYYIWYGNWTGNNAPTLLQNLAAAIGGSPYFNINTTYYNSAGLKVSGLVHFGGYTNDNYSQGSALSDAQVQAVVSSAISSGRLPKDTNGVYFV